MSRSGSRGEALSIFRNALSAYGNRGVVALSVIVLTPILFRKLGVAGYGTWSVILVLGSVYTLIELGLGRGVSKIVAEEVGLSRRERLEEAVGTAVTFLSAIGLVTAASAVAVGVFASGLAPAAEQHDFRLAMLILGVERLVYAPAAAYCATLQGYQRYDLVNLASSLNTVLFTVGAIVAALLGAGVLGVAVAYCAGHLLQGVAYLLYLRRVDPALPLGPVLGRRAERWRLVNMSSFVLFAESMTFIGQRMDTLVIASIRNAAAAAPYAAALKLQTGLQSLSLPVVYQLMPMVSDLWSRGESAEVRRRLTLATRAAMQVTLPVAAALALFADDVIGLWLGSSAPSVTASILVALMVAQVVMLTASPAEQVLVGVGRVRLIGLLALVDGFSNLGVSILLVSRYGAIGAAIGTLVTSAVLAPVKLPLAARALRMPVGTLAWDGLVRPVVSTLPSLAAMTVVRVVMPEGTLRLLVGVAVGLGLALVVGAVQIGPDRLRSTLQLLGRPTPDTPGELGVEA